jgi:hypothetical protein
MNLEKCVCYCKMNVDGNCTAKCQNRSRPTPSRNILDTDLCVCGLTEQECQDKIAQVREDAIEQLGDLNKYACFEYEEASLSDNEREMMIHLEYGNRVWGIIRSLRTEGGEP